MRWRVTEGGTYRHPSCGFWDAVRKCCHLGWARAKMRPVLRKRAR